MFRFAGDFGIGSVRASGCRRAVLTGFGCTFAAGFIAIVTRTVNLDCPTVGSLAAAVADVLFRSAETAVALQFVALAAFQITGHTVFGVTPAEAAFGAAVGNALVLGRTDFALFGIAAQPAG